jgi:hypothetical protein
MSQNIIKFNIGGTRYEVSHSLLQSYPNTMLAKCAEEQWHKDPKAEIFIDRNGFRFQHVLDYLRDCKVSLPPTVTKASLISDLQYYGVEHIIEDKIDDYLVNGYTFGRTYECAHKVMNSWEIAARQAEKEVNILRNCISIYSTFIKSSPNPASKDISTSFIHDCNTLKYWPKECNAYLQQVGLSVEKVESGWVYLKIHDT